MIVLRSSSVNLFGNHGTIGISVFSFNSAKRVLGLLLADVAKTHFNERGKKHVGLPSD